MFYQHQLPIHLKFSRESGERYKNISYVWFLENLKENVKEIR